MTNKIIVIFSSFSLLLLLSCSNNSEFENKATVDYSSTKMQKYAKYMIQGKSLYTTHCSNCHQANGEGLGKVYPPLKGSDYLLSDQSNTYCLIKNGISERIIVNGIAYKQTMPANEQLSNLEIAEISTYIYNSWGHEYGIIETSEVEKSLKSCKN